MLLRGPLGPWQALLMSPKGRNASRDGFVNLNISLNSIAPIGSLAPVELALLFCFSLIRRSLSIVTTWNQQYNKYQSTARLPESHKDKDSWHEITSPGVRNIGPGYS